MTADTTILIVEDEPAIVELLTFTLRGAGWHTVAAETVAQAAEALKTWQPQLMLLDWMLPDQSGLRFLARVRNDRDLQQLPVIMLTAKSMDDDKVAGLDVGADDYITKPFSPRELISRVKALLRRKSPEHEDAVLAAGPLRLDPASVSVTLHGARIDIGQAEFKLLKFFLAHPERVFSRAQLLDQVWGNHVAVEERTVDVHVLRLRKALRQAQTMVQTVRGIGYMFSEK